MGKVSSIKDRFSMNGLYVTSNFLFRIPIFVFDWENIDRLKSQWMKKLSRWLKNHSRFFLKKTIPTSIFRTVMPYTVLHSIIKFL